MKLGVTYIVFDGVELLEHSIKQIRNQVDFISVLYQSFSWFGDKADSSDLQLLNDLKSSKLIDDLSLFTSFTPLTKKDSRAILLAKDYERKKRQSGLQRCLIARCSHYLCMDVDEFYVSQQFKAAKDEIICSGYESTAVRLINYVKTPTLHRGYDSNYVPFICKIAQGSKMTSSFFVKCDPTRGITSSSAKKLAFDPSLITMHHMETVRKNLNLKYSSTTRAIFKRERTSELVNRINAVTEVSSTFDFNQIIFPGVKNIKLTSCENIFNIPYETWEK